MALRQLNDTGELEDTQRGRYLTFALGEEIFGIEIRHVLEIIGILPITRLPGAPDYIKGIINLRGRIIPVVDVRLKFKKPAAAYDDRTCIIVTETQDISVGLIIDHVTEVVTIEDEDIVPPPQYADGQARYIQGISKADGKVVLLLDCVTLFSEEAEAHSHTPRKEGVL